MSRDAGLRDRLSGGNPRSLQGVPQVVADVVAGDVPAGSLFALLWDPDDVVRMRAADALEKVCRQRPELVAPFTESLLDDVSRIDQPSVRWHLAQLLEQLPLAGEQRVRSVDLLKRQLRESDDWIVVTCTLSALARFARDGDLDPDEWTAVLDTRARDPRRAVQSRVAKLRRMG